MQLTYVEKLNGYVDLESPAFPGIVYTDEDLDFLLELERKWKESLPEYNFYELIKIYPTAKNKMSSNINERLKHLKERKRKYLNYMEDHVMKLFGELDGMETAEVKDMLEKEKEDFLQEIAAEEKKLKFQKQYLKRMIGQEKMQKKIEEAKKKKDVEAVKKAEEELETAMKEERPDGITEEMIVRAKGVPLSNFVKVGRDGKIKCLKHNEKTPSMHIYRKKNNFYCFSCGWHGTAIDLIMELQGLDFKGAVKYLNNV